LNKSGSISAFLVWASFDQVNNQLRFYCQRKTRSVQPSLYILHFDYVNSSTVPHLPQSTQLCFCSITHNPTMVWITWAKYMFEFRKLSIQSSYPLLSHYREVALTIVMLLVYPSKENGGYLSVTNNKA
jgi:hypothetical protein